MPPCLWLVCVKKLTERREKAMRGEPHLAHHAFLCHLEVNPYFTTTFWQLLPAFTM